MSVFTAAKQEVWRKFSEEVSGKFIQEKLTGNISLEVIHGPWHVIFDTSEAGGHEEGFFSTRLRAPIVNPQGFRFKIHQEGFVTRVGKLVGLKDLEIGNAEFDEAFILKCEQKEKGLELFKNPEIQAQMLKMKNVHLEIKDSEGRFGPKFMPDEDELCLEISGIVTELKTLEDLFHLFAITLDVLVDKGFILPKEPQTHIEA